MAKITVITPTVRPEGLKLVSKALLSQTFPDFEWLIVCPKAVGKTSKKLKLAKHKIIIDPPKETGDAWSLNKACNQALRAAKGELIVSWQDFTFAEPSALAKFWYYYISDPKIIVTGVGNKYSQVLPRLGTIVWKDPRENDDLHGIFECRPAWIEANFCAVPKTAFYAVGGFDEYLDKYFGMDAYSVFDRLGILGGWKFYIDQTNKSYSLPHSRLPDWEEKNAIHGPYQERRQQYLVNPVLNYLG